MSPYNAYEKSHGLSTQITQGALKAQDNKASNKGPKEKKRATKALVFVIKKDLSQITRIVEVD